MQYIIISFASLVGVIFLTPYFIDLLNRIKIIDKPDGDRKLHNLPIPRLGGFILFLVLMTSIFIFYDDLRTVKFFVFGSLLIVTLGVYDDIMNAGWVLKLVYQTVGTFLLLLFLVPQFSSLTLFNLELPLIPSIIVLTFFIIWTINSFNLLDGLDGLVAGITLLVAVLLFFISLNQMNIFLLVMLASLSGCLIGFLKYNAYPARIFLGDSGSLFLGYVIVGSVLLLSINATSKVLDLTFAVILLAVPIADAINVVLKRILNGRHPFLGDRSHLHHVVFSKNITHKTTVFIITLYSLFFAANAIYYRFYSEMYGIVLFFVLLIPLTFANKLLSFMINREKLLLFGRTINRFPEILIYYYKIGIVPVTSIFVLFSFVFVLAAGRNLTPEFLVPSFVILGVLLVFTFINYRKNRHYTDIIVFFNVLMFFIINQSNTLLYQDLSQLPLLGNLNYHLLIVSVLFPVTGFFLLFRDRIKEQREVFFTALDLVIVLLLVLLSISSTMLPVAKSFIVTDTIFRSFLIYSFYKVLIQIQPKFRPSLYAFSFLAVILSQTFILFL